MAFGKTAEQVLAEEFPGKTKEQIKEMLASFDTIKAKADKADLTEGNLVNATTELAQLKVRLAEVEAGRRTNNNNEGNNNNQPTKPDWSEDADAAFNDRSKPLAVGIMETRAEMMYDRVTRNLSSDPYFAKFRKEFDEEVKKGSVQQRAMQEFIENCYNVVYARHRNEILRDVRAGSGEFFVETGRGQGNTTFSDVKPDAAKTLSEEEKREAAKFGLTPEKWLETRNKIKFVGGQLINM